MLFPDLSVPWWAGSLDAAGVVAVLVLWIGLRDVTARGRALAATCGAVVLVFLTGGALARAYGLAFFNGYRGIADVGGLRRWEDIGLAVAGLVAGVVFASLYRHPEVEDDGEDEVPVLTERTEIPGAVWSRPEVIGDGPEVGPDVVVVAEPPRPAARRLPERHGLPLIAIAIGLGLPVFSYGSGPGESFGQTARHLGGYGIAARLLGGVAVGLALLGALLAFEVWERVLGWVSFALVAAGVAAFTAWPAFFANERWTSAAIGLAAGLLVRGTLAALRLVARADGRTVVAGVLAALALLGASGVLSGRLYSEQQRFDSESSF